MQDIDNMLDEVWHDWFKNKTIVGNDPYFLKKDKFKSHLKTLLLEARIDELSNFMEAITLNEAEREIRGKDCIKSYQWKRLYSISQYRLNQLKDELKKRSE